MAPPFVIHGARVVVRSISYTSADEDFAPRKLGCGYFLSR